MRLSHMSHHCENLVAIHMAADIDILSARDRGRRMPVSDETGLRFAHTEPVEDPYELVDDSVVVPHEADDCIVDESGGVFCLAQAELVCIGLLVPPVFGSQRIQWHIWAVRDAEGQ